ncbi:MAG TPA: galactokinase [Gemmatimonadaceae bacterium]|nr:galactokinase [Gemmatimonadaceae bacterium]
MSTDARRSFRSLFGTEPTTRADAPGRVNLIGEHTDYNGGFVLPLAIPQRTRVELAKRGDGTVRAWSANVPDEVSMREYRLGAERRSGDWIDYVQGVTDVLAREGHRLGGCDLRIESSVPVGSGLSSSAALEVALLRALRSAFNLPVDDVRLAVIGRRVENEFVGAPVGIMDQMAASLADEHTALFLDTRSLETRAVSLPEALELLVINSGVAHNHAAGDYRTRRAECERAAAQLGVPELRNVSVDDLPRVNALPDPLSRRARHVVTENARVLAAVDALGRSDLVRFGMLLNESHASMRDDFEVSIPEIDLLVELAVRERDVFGARLTGGGFGGSIIVATRRGAGARLADLIAREYDARGAHRATVLVPPTSGN